MFKEGLSVLIAWVYQYVNRLIRPKRASELEETIDLEGVDA